MMIYGVLIYWNWNKELSRVWRINKKKKKKIFVDFIDGEDVDVNVNVNESNDNKQD